MHVADFARVAVVSTAALVLAAPVLLLEAALRALVTALTSGVTLVLGLIALLDYYQVMHTVVDRAQYAAASARASAHAAIACCLHPTATPCGAAATATPTAPAPPAGVGIAAPSAPGDKLAATASKRVGWFAWSVEAASHDLAYMTASLDAKTGLLAKLGRLFPSPVVDKWADRLEALPGGAAVVKAARRLHVRYRRERAAMGVGAPPCNCWAPRAVAATSLASQPAVAAPLASHAVVAAPQAHAGSPLPVG